MQGIQLLIVTILGFVLSYFFVFSYAHEVYAASFIVSPVVLDTKAKARDILKESLTLTNNTSSKLNVYTFVNNISTLEGQQEFMDPSVADHASSLANWIEISRAVLELGPREERKINFDINVNLRAKPGMYHALISFVPGATRDEAETRLRDAPSVTVNLEVLEDIKERLQLKKFIADKTFFFGSPASLSYELENIGNRNVIPSGEIRIYNRRGEEVGAVEVNNEKGAVEVNEVKKFASTWRGLGEREETKQLASLLGTSGGFGKYKAFLDLEYGLTERGTVQDTIYFWAVPLRLLFITLGVAAMTVTMLILLLRRRRKTHTYVPDIPEHPKRKGALRPHRAGTDKPRHRNIIDLRDIKKL